MRLRQAASHGALVGFACVAAMTASPSHAQAPPAVSHPATDPSVPFNDRLDKVIARGVCRVIVADGQGDDFGSGSGFVIAVDGFIITNYHVVDGAASARVEFPEQSFKAKAQLWQTWPQFDLALLKIDAATLPATLTPLPLSPSRPGRAADVWTLGFPLSTTLGLTITKGVVNALRNREELASLVNTPADRAVVGQFDPAIRFVQIDSTINRGNSGGPLVDGRGYVIGVNTLSLMSANDFFLAVSAEHVGVVFAQRRAQPQGFPPVTQVARRAPTAPQPPGAANQPGRPYPPGTNYPPGAARREQPPAPPVEIVLPNLGAPFYRYDAPLKRTPLAVASAAAREVSQFRLQSCAGCGGKGQVTKQETVGIDNSGGFPRQIVETVKRRCDRCGGSGKTPPKDTLVLNVTRRFVSTLAATDAAATGVIDEASDPQGAELLRRVNQTAWKDVAEWGGLAKATREMLDKPVTPGQPVMTLGRVVAVLPDSSAKNAFRYAVATPLNGFYFVTGRQLAVDVVGIGDRVVLFGVTGAPAHAEGAQWVAIHGGAMKRCN